MALEADSADHITRRDAMPAHPRPTPPYRPGDPPPSEDELAGINNGPCRSFKPMEPPWDYTCRKCGYPHR